MKKTLLFSTLAFFTSMGANAVTWTGTEDLSAINAQIVDGGSTDYVLSPIAASPITGDGVQIDGVSMGLINSFTFDSGDIANPYVMSGGNNNGMLELASVEMNDVLINADITNTASGTTTHHGVDIMNSQIHNTISVGGTINLPATYSYGNSSSGIRLSAVSGGSFISTADITSGMGFGISLINNTNLTGDVDISGIINSYNTGIKIQIGSLGGFRSTADITTSHFGNNAIFLSDLTITNDIDIGGAVDTSLNATKAIWLRNISATSFASTADIVSGEVGLLFENITMAGAVSVGGTIDSQKTGLSLSGSADSFTSTANITSATYSAISVFDTTITNGIDISGIINDNATGDSAIFIRNTTADSFTSTADITAASAGIRFDNVDIAGAITIGGTFTTTYPYSQILFGQFDSTAGSILINSGYLNSSPNATLTVSGAVDIQSSNGASLTNLTADSLSFGSDINSGHYGIYLKDVTLANNLDFSGITTINALSYGLYLNNVSSANEIDLSTIQSITSTSVGLTVSNTTLSSLTSAIDMTTSNYGINLGTLNVTGAIDLSGTISSSYAGITLGTVTADSFTSTADITSTNQYGIYSATNTAFTNADISGTINAYSDGLYFYTTMIDSLTSTADITSSTKSGIQLRSTILGTSTISGTINAETYGLQLWTATGGDITSTADITANTEHGIYLYSGSSINSLVNNGSITSNAKAAIAGDTGGNVLNYAGTGTLSGATYDIDMGTGTDTVNISNATINDLSVNSAEIINVASDVTIGGTGLAATGVTTSSAITNDGSIAGITMDSTNEVLTYTGTGTLNGATYDIDMGAGADVLNITGMTMAAPRINNSERVNIYNSVLQLDLTDANKGTTLLTLDGTTQL
ncbi:MAG: hypothetical protein JXQ74_02685, partial [Alphaproteobacteria bacterium]|nr:hypothetical protein [Alphaproteobacteria bacterium]